MRDTKEIGSVGAAEKIRICFVTSEFVTESTFAGGLANYLGRVTRALSQAGHDVHVIVKGGEDASFDFHGVTVHRVLPVWDRRMILDRIDGLVPRALYAPYQDIKTAWVLWTRWRRLRRTARFDVVQIANVLAVGLCFRFEREVPVVARMSSYRPLWDTLAGTPNTIARRARWFLERLSVMGAAHVIAPTRFVADLVRENYRVAVEVLETPFFLDRHLSDATPALSVGPGYGLFFGRATQMKGAHVLAEALPIANDLLPDFTFAFVGGEGSAPDGGGMRDYIRSKTRPFAERIEIRDAVPHEQLYPIIERARIVVLPSICDNMPNALLEAMGHGKIVIATRGTCFEEVIDDGVSGFLVPPGDAHALADAIVMAWSLDAARKAEISANAKASVARFGPEYMIPNFERYYRTVAAKSAQRTFA